MVNPFVGFQAEPFWHVVEGEEGWTGWSEGVGWGGGDGFWYLLPFLGLRVRNSKTGRGCHLLSFGDNVC